ncbi:MAG: ankyrin repeat domain-containing protein [Planctomycetota bacterium]
MCDAISAGDVSAVVDLLETDPELLYTPIFYKCQSLHMACWGKHLAVVDELIRRGANVDARGTNGRTPLHFALEDPAGREDEVASILQLLITAQADVEAVDDFGLTPLAQLSFTMVPPSLGELVRLLHGYE